MDPGQVASCQRSLISYFSRRGFQIGPPRDLVSVTMRNLARPGSTYSDGVHGMGAGGGDLKPLTEA